MCVCEGERQTDRQTDRHRNRGRNERGREGEGEGERGDEIGKGIDRDRERGTKKQHTHLPEFATLPPYFTGLMGGMVHCQCYLLCDWLIGRAKQYYEC